MTSAASSETNPGRHAPEWAHAVVPTLDHLSKQVFIRDALKHMVELLAGPVFVIRLTNMFVSHGRGVQR